MSKARDRITKEWDQSSQSLGWIDFTLAQIRARRDELDKSPRWQTAEFWRLFDDGAEFGPDKKEPEYQFEDNRDGSMRVRLPGCPYTTISNKMFNAIKKLGREEVKDE